MDQSATLTKRFSPRASLAAIGLKLQQLKLFDSISRSVNIGYFPTRVTFVS